MKGNLVNPIRFFATSNVQSLELLLIGTESDCHCQVLSWVILSPGLGGQTCTLEINEGALWAPCWWKLFWNLLSNSRLGVDFVLPLSQEQEEQEQPPPKKWSLTPKTQVLLRLCSHAKIPVPFAKLPWDFEVLKLFKNKILPYVAP